MKTIIQTDKEFKEAIGAFVIAFSELEFGLAHLGTMTEFDLRKKEKYLITHMGYSFEQKVKSLTAFIEEHLSEIKPIWDIIKNEIGQINSERRFIVHGLVQYFLPKESITAYIKQGKAINKKELSISTIKELTNRIYHLNTGENGINGEFHTLFSKTRINKWNELVNNENKIIYRINNNIVSDWKGKAST